jgi:uncharacterized protein (DUF2267 family)
MEPERDQKEILNKIKKELSLKSTGDVVPLLASVLHSLRQTLTLEHSTLFLNRLPEFLKIIFVSNWKQDERHVRIDHLDEFINLVMDRDRQTGKFLFKSEVQTLFIVILVLRMLYNLIDIKNFDGLSHMFRRELREAAMEVDA